MKLPDKKEEPPVYTFEEKIILLRKLNSERSPGQWHCCNKGECSCVTVMTDDYPIARCESGNWGDEYPAIRVKDFPSIEGKVEVEAYMERMDYGYIEPSLAKANIKFIQSAPMMMEVIEELLQRNQ